jgi:glutamate N-acetyltransferase / amino-acid N-acetyltransferase
MKQSFPWIKGGVTAAKGFLANGLFCGIKRTGRPDTALIWSEKPCRAAAVFTQNRFKAHPVQISMERAKRGQVQAILVNSGNANCLNGKRGFKKTEALSRHAAMALGIPERLLWLASTGVIGEPLPTEKIQNKLPSLIKGLSRKRSRAAAAGILTTDRVRKEVAVRFMLGGKQVTLGGMTKGAGMIQPNMATMLAFLTTDACLSRKALQKALSVSCARSFNRITVDGQMSTNDTVYLMSSGLAANREVGVGSTGFQIFQKALSQVTSRLAEMIVMDGEGVTRMMKVQVTGARTAADAECVAGSVANSPLVKTMIHGADPNWGRVLQAVGATMGSFHPKQVRVMFGSHCVFRKGEKCMISNGKMKALFRKKMVPIRIDLGAGRHETEILSGDLSALYVRVNTHYGT